MKKNLSKLVKYWLPCFIWAYIIFTFSSYPTGIVSTFDWQDFVVKKTAHIVEYALLSVLLYRAMKSLGVGRVAAGLYSVSLIVLYGISDEFHQSLIPGRTSRLLDIGFDTIGGSFGIYIVWNILPKLHGKPKSWAKALELL